MIKIKDLPPPENRYPVKRALLSVFDKSGLVPFAQTLHERGIVLLSTGGTARTLREAGLPVTDVSALTSYPEILDGRVKTLHPVVHGGLLARRNDPEDMRQIGELGIETVDLVVVNLYPFSEAVSREGVSEAEAVENIDIGGPTMLRAAAKNFFYVGVVTSPGQYVDVAAEIEQEGSLSLETRRRLAGEAFRHTARYDAAITDYFAGTSEIPDFPGTLDISIPLDQRLRYGENPHQAAALYGDTARFFETLHGKELSFNNLMDVTAALRLVDEFSHDVPACAILKHTNPCGVAVASSLAEAYDRAFATDRQSPFGGIVVVNRALDRVTAENIDRIFTEIIIAPEFEEGVLELLKAKKNRRLIRTLLPAREDRAPDIRSVVGGLLVQEQDPVLPPSSQSGYRVVTERSPTDGEWRDLDFAWRVVKHVKSNAIVYARGGSTLGIGAGQMSRIDSSEIAVMKGRKSELDFAGSAVASDAFFPFADGLIAAAETGALSVIQPGGSVRDEEVIKAANERGMTMVFTGSRHFRH
ncbi:MAG: bifunctional phosphoribosylaminoimidazolecarboxamide formyltransferase/IMP cyclohydrolase [Rhodothermales bacterium]